MIYPCAIIGVSSPGPILHFGRLSLESLSLDPGQTRTSSIKNTISLILVPEFVCQEQYSRNQYFGPHWSSLGPCTVQLWADQRWVSIFPHKTPLNGYRWTRLDSRNPNLTFFENFENFGNFEKFMQNVGKRISHKEKKRILSLDTIHESIDSGSGRRGGKEKKAPIDSQNMSLTRNTEKKIPLLAPSDSQAYFSR